MRTVRYWFAENLHQGQAYNLRARTKKELVAKIASYGDDAKDYGVPRKTQIEFTDLFDLVDNCLGEGRGNCGE